MPVPYTATQLKARFETGDVPTQQDFADLIDTVFHMSQQALDQADAAVALAEKAAAVYALYSIDYPGGDGAMAYTVRRQVGCTVTMGTSRALATVSSANSHWLVTATITITPDEDFADDDTTVLHNPSHNENATGSTNYAVDAAGITRAIGSIVIVQKFLFVRSTAASRLLNTAVMP